MQRQRKYQSRRWKRVISDIVACLRKGVYSGNLLLGLGVGPVPFRTTPDVLLYDTARKTLPNVSRTMR